MILKVCRQQSCQAYSRDSATQVCHPDNATSGRLQMAWQPSKARYDGAMLALAEPAISQFRLRHSCSLRHEVAQCAINMTDEDM